MKSLKLIALSSGMLAAVISAAAATPGESLQNARRIFENGRYAEAAPAFRNIVVQHPSAPEAAVAAYYVGLAEERNGKRDAALDAYRKMLATYGASSDLASFAKQRIREIERNAPPASTEPAAVSNQPPVAQTDESAVDQLARNVLREINNRAAAPSGTRSPSTRNRSRGASATARPRTNENWPSSSASADVQTAFPTATSENLQFPERFIAEPEARREPVRENGVKVVTFPTREEIVVAAEPISSSRVVEPAVPQDATAGRIAPTAAPEPRMPVIPLSLNASASATAGAVTVRHERRSTGGERTLDFGLSGGREEALASAEKPSVQQPSLSAAPAISTPPMPAPSHAAPASPWWASVDPKPTVSRSALPPVSVPSPSLVVGNDLSEIGFGERPASSGVKPERVHMPPIRVNAPLVSLIATQSGKTVIEKPREADVLQPVVAAPTPVEEPVVKPAVVQPVEEPVVEPVAVKPAEEPVAVKPAEEPVAVKPAEEPVAAPVVETPAEEPVTRPELRGLDALSAFTAAPVSISQEASTDISPVSATPLELEPAMPTMIDAQMQNSPPSAPVFEDFASAPVEPPAMIIAVPSLNVSPVAPPVSPMLEATPAVTTSAVEQPAAGAAASVADGQGGLPQPMYTVSIDPLRRAVVSEMSVERPGSAGQARSGNVITFEPPRARSAVEGNIIRAVEFRKLGLVDQAIAEYRKAIEAEPSHPIACNNLADLYVEQGEKLEEAVDLVTTALSGEIADRGPYYSTLGWAYAKLGDLVNAEKFMNESLKSGITSGRLYRRAMVYAAMGLAARARADLDKALVYSEDAATTAAIKKAYDDIDANLPIQGTVRGVR